MSDDERAFIAASVAKVRAEQAGRARTRRIVTWGSVAAVLALAVTGWWAYGVYTERNIIRAEAARTDIRGEIVAFATAKGQFALDTLPGRKTSPYTSALLLELADRNKTVLGALTSLNQRVIDNSSGQQRPFLATSMNGNVYLWNQPDTRKRMAVVVSVDNMGIETARLVAPKHDADAYADLLRKIGLAETEIVRLHNPGRAEFLASLETALGTFRPAKSESTAPNSRSNLVIKAGIVLKPKEKREENTLFLFYFSGNGIAISSGNFLILESNRSIKAETDLLHAGVNIETVISQISAVSAASIVVLDTNFPYSLAAAER